MQPNISIADGRIVCLPSFCSQPKLLTSTCLFSPQPASRNHLQPFNHLSLTAGDFREPNKIFNLTPEPLKLLDLSLLLTGPYLFLPKNLLFKLSKF